MRHLLAATALFLASPAYAGLLECITPPNTPAGTAQWSTDGKIVEEYLVTSNADLYYCGPNIIQNKPSRGVGSKNYFKRVCGPLTIVEEVTFRNCTLEERVGISSGFGFSSRLAGLNSELICSLSSNVISDTRYELRDKNGQTFQLGTEYGSSRGDSNISETCNASKKTSFYTKIWKVGSTSKEIRLTTVMEYQVEHIKQPEL